VRPFSSFRRGLPWKRGLVGAYATILLVSFARHEQEGGRCAPEGTAVITVPAIDGNRRTTEQVRLAFRDVESAPAPAGIPVLLLHGSPGNGNVFRGLAAALGHGRRLVIPDLPGFGHSTLSIPDYSLRAHARYVLDLLDQLGLGRVHVLGFSMGGGVALEIAAQDGPRVASMVMLSAVGVQEMELLSNYYLNHAVHGVQLGAMWALRILLPAGRSFDSGWAYARNFYDSDQRPLRAALERFDPPMLIVHGRLDPLVPVEAAAEHARLVPQAQLTLLDGDHFMTFQDPARLAPPILQFLDRVDTGRAVARAQASPERRRAAAVPFDPRTVPRVRALTAVVVIGFAALVAAAGWAAASAVSYRRRRLLVSSWRRLTHWEFWPLWAAYVPVALYIVWLMLRHRSPTVFTAANPAIEAGGVVGESKFAILRGLASSGHLAASALIEGGLPLEARRDRAAMFMAEHDLSLPVVLKPDAGQRGTGVVVARTREELEQALAGAHSDTVIQAYVGGEEFGVFYVRRPSEPHGRILSITRKLLPEVRGDGLRPLEHLILDDERAVCMARFHLAQQHARLADVPGAGVTVSLGDCGSHCRGAVFLDGARLRTSALERAIDGVAQSFPGFYFGRFDLRVPSAAALAEGRDFTILELNGVTSEPTHIYDPAVPLAAAYGALLEQWRMAFEIGAENAARGARVTSITGLIGLAWRYRRGSPRR
jgi:pimeloyl-ACP methyl ester carboxylesterase